MSKDLILKSLLELPQKENSTWESPLCHDTPFLGVAVDDASLDDPPPCPQQCVAVPRFCREVHRAA